MKVVGVLFFTVLQAALSTALSVGFALPLAYFFNRFSFPGKRFLLACAALLCILPTKLIVFSIAHFWALDGLSGIVLAHLMLNLPFSLFVLNLACQKLDATMVWVACDLGATSWQCYKHVVLPFLKSTILSLAIILFLLHVTSYSIPVLLGTAWYHQTPDIVMSDLYNAGHVDQVFLLGLLRLFVCLPLILLLTVPDEVVTKAGHRSLQINPERYRIFEHGWWWLAYGMCMLLLTLAPMVTFGVACCTGPMLVFFKAVLSGMVDPVLEVSVLHVVLVSCLLAVLSALGAVAVAWGLCLAHRIVRRRAGRKVVVFLSVLPLLLGSVGVGIATLWWSHLVVVPALIVAIVCHVVLNYPFAYRVINAQFDRYHDDMVKSAQAMGATRWQALRTVLIPFVWPAFLMAWSVSFGLSLTEVGASSVLEKSLGMTMPMAVRVYRAAGKQTELMGLNLIVVVIVMGVTYVCSRPQSNRRLSL